MRIETTNELKRKLFSGHRSDSSLVRDITRMEDKKLSESVKLNRIIKAAETNSPRLALFNEFLSCNVLSQVINTKIFPKYKKGILAIAADAVLKDEFDIIKKMWFGYRDDIKPANVEEIYTDINESQDALVLGYYFMKNKETNENMIFAIDFIEGWDTGYIAMYTNEDSAKDGSAIMKKIIVWSKENNFLKNKTIDACGRFVKVDNITMDDIIIKDEVKRRIKSGTIDMLANAETYRKNKLPIKRGILMEGEPGTGKTLLAKALSNQLESTFIWVTADDITKPYHVSAIYDMARELAPTVILFEDIDYIGKDRGDYAEGSFDKITGELLNQMDGLQSNEGIITLASSNYPKALDKALRNRPGRFDIRVKFPLPDEDIRLKMFQQFFGKIEIQDVPFADMVAKTEGYTGAYIKELVTATVMLAVTGKSIKDDGTAIVSKKFFDEAYDELEKSRRLDEEEDE